MQSELSQEHDDWGLWVHVTTDLDMRKHDHYVYIIWILYIFTNR
jgi:hypothetical protein